MFHLGHERFTLDLRGGEFMVEVSYLTFESLYSVGVVSISLLQLTQLPLERCVRLRLAGNLQQ